jgi:UrcA family protein
MRTYVLALAASLLIASPVCAQPDAPRQAVVHVGDLNLASPEGQAALEGRINRAVESVCSSESRNLKQVVAAKRCSKEASSEARIGVALAKARTHDLSSTTQLAGH